MPNLLEIVENGSHYRINFTDSAAVTASALIKFRLNRPSKKKASSTRKSVDQPSLLFGDKHDRGEKVTNDDPESDDVFVLGVKTAFGAAIRRLLYLVNYAEQKHGTRAAVEYCDKSVSKGDDLRQSVSQDSRYPICR